jgi:hypothetical protein
MVGVVAAAEVNPVAWLRPVVAEAAVPAVLMQ